MQGLERRRFLNWEAMLVCSTKRAMGNASDDTPLDVRFPPRNPWLDGWADVLDIINSHAQVCAGPRLPRRCRARETEMCRSSANGAAPTPCPSASSTLPWHLSPAQGSIYLV